MGEFESLASAARFIYLNRKGLTEHEEFDQVNPIKSLVLVQRAINLLDYSSWKQVLTASDFASDTVSKQQMLEVPVSQLKLVQRAYLDYRHEPGHHRLNGPDFCRHRFTVVGFGMFSPIPSTYQISEHGTGSGDQNKGISPRNTAHDMIAVPNIVLDLYKGSS
ncbi:hypothetical protein BZL43_04465 [Pseudomonas sp. PICF141]|nr:hypothetical protein BZL43_04465 [Pseudomonas sp. PICF141]